MFSNNLDEIKEASFFKNELLTLPQYEKEMRDSLEMNPHEGLTPAQIKVAEHTLRDIIHIQKLINILSKISEQKPITQTELELILKNSGFDHASMLKDYPHMHETYTADKNYDEWLYQYYSWSNLTVDEFFKKNLAFLNDEIEKIKSDKLKEITLTSVLSTSELPNNNILYFLTLIYLYFSLNLNVTIKIDPKILPQMDDEKINFYLDPKIYCLLTHTNKELKKDLTPLLYPFQKPFIEEIKALIDFLKENNIHFSYPMLNNILMLGSRIDEGRECFEVKLEASLLKEIKAISSNYRKFFTEWFSLPANKIYCAAKLFTELLQENLLTDDTLSDGLKLFTNPFTLPDIKPSTVVKTKRDSDEGRSKIVLDEKHIFYLEHNLKRRYLKYDMLDKIKTKIKKAYNSLHDETPSYIFKAKLIPNSKKSAERVQAFKDEAKYAQFFHKKPAYYFTRNTNWHYLLLPYQAGEDLARHMQKNPSVNFKIQLNRCYQIFDIVSVLHEKHMILQDIKPHNFILNEKTELVSPVDLNVVAVGDITHSSYLFTRGFAPLFIGKRACYNSFYPSMFGLNSLLLNLFPTVRHILDLKTESSKPLTIEEKAILTLSAALQPEMTADHHSYCTSTHAREYLKSLLITEKLDEDKLMQIAKTTIDHPTPNFQTIAQQSRRYRLFRKLEPEKNSSTIIPQDVRKRM